MKATVFHGAKDIRVEEVPHPHAGVGEAVMREALGIQETFEKALRCLRPGGIIRSLGVYSGKLQVW